MWPIPPRLHAMSEANQPSEGELILYQTPEGTVRIEVMYESDTFWLNQKKIAELFGVDVRTISEHLRNIFTSGELVEASVIRKFRTTAADGKSYLVSFYNLDAIISAGYRVNSTQVTQFRVWATQTPREFVIKGFVLDDERLKLNKRFGKDYFDELLERIREIRAPVSGASTSRSPTFTSSAASITTRMLRSPRRSSKRSRTNCIGPSPAARPPRSSRDAPTQKSRPWA
jgi:hypothetical protein